MNVEPRRRRTFDHVFEDDDFQTLAALFLAEAVVRAFVVTMIREFEEAPPITFANSGLIWGAAHVGEHPGLAQGVSDAGRLLDLLYARHGTVDAGNLRGAVLEGLVMESLGDRYGNAMLLDNVEFTITNGTTYTSPRGRPIDVLGWDGLVGECHDCKMKPRFLDADFIMDLADGLPRPEFALGVVTAMSEVTARAEMKSKLGYAPPAHVNLIAVEHLLDFVPLQRAA